VLGAPLYMGRWHKDAQRFLSWHQEALTQRSVAIFALGPFHDPTDDKEWQAVRVQLDQELAKYPWLKPVALELFGGKYDPAKLRFPDSFIASLPASPLHNAPASDVRDWTTIRIWASNLATKLLSPVHLPVLPAPARTPLGSGAGLLPRDPCGASLCRDGAPVGAAQGRQDGQPALPQ
jgi:hypothetical protein